MNGASFASQGLEDYTSLEGGIVGSFAEPSIPLSSRDGRRSDLPRKYEPKALNPLHHEILRRLLLGDSHKEIASILNCTVATVSNVANSGLGREKISVMTAEADLNSVEIAKQIRETAPRAVEVMRELLDDEAVSFAVKYRAAADILDRAGHGAVKKIDMRKTLTELSMEDLERLNEAARNRMVQAGLMIDVSGE